MGAKRFYPASNLVSWRPINERQKFALMTDFDDSL